MFLQHQHFDRNQTLYWLKTQIRLNLLNLIFFLPFLTINFDYQRYINYTESLFLLRIKLAILKLTILHQLTQEAIDAIANKQPLLAKKKIDSAQELINDLTDYTTINEELIELSKYQTLITMLNNKLK